MLQIPFTFKPLNIKGIVGQPTDRWDQLHIYELTERGSNSFILGYVPRLEDAKAYFKQHYNLEIADSKGVIRNNFIHDFVPCPELSGADFQNMCNCIKQIYGLHPNNNTYLYYAVDLVNSVILFDTFDAADLKEARNIASNYLSDTLHTKVLIKNLKLNATKNSMVEHSYNLSNAYIGQLQDMNKYYTHNKYLVGCVKYSSSLSRTVILNDWVYQCYTIEDDKAYETNLAYDAKEDMKKDKVKFIHNSLREARTFSKEVRQYLYEIEKERPLTEPEKKLWDKTHDIHVHTNDSGMLIQEEYDDIF